MRKIEVKLLQHQKEALEVTKDFTKTAYYYDMGLGKTFIGSEKLKELNANINLVICQKSKLNDWYEHFKTYYPQYNTKIYKNANDLKADVLIINYDLVWRRPKLLELKDFTLMLDESSCIKNEKSNRTKFILKMKPTNVILLSGTPTGGKYEELYSQCKLLGWKISKKAFWENYIETKKMAVNGFKIPIVIGYKNVDRLKEKLREHGAVFKKTEEVIDLPEQIDNIIKVNNTKEYEKFKKNRLITIDLKNLCEFKDDSDFYGKDITPRIELVGDTTLTKLLYQRQLASQYNSNKTTKLRDLLESTNDRVIVFYNFKEELEKIEDMCIRMERPISVVNGQNKDLKAYENESNSITLIQYQAGAMGLNLQKSNKIIYFSLPLSSELFEQSKKRIHRIGQKKSCMYYYLITENTIEEKIFEVLSMRKDFTNKLFEEIDPGTTVVKEEKRVSVTKLFDKDGFSTYIDDDNYMGCAHFFLREDLCKADFKRRVKKLYVREVVKDTFKAFTKLDYKFSEKDLEEHENYYIIKNGENITIIQKIYYKYFKQEGYQFRFSDDEKGPIGLFKNNEWVGVVLPMVIKEKAATKECSPSKEDVTDIPEDDLPF